MMQANSPLKELDNTSSLQLLVGKLPYRLKNLWRAKVYDLQEEKLRTVGFKDLVDFVGRHAQIVSNPAFGTISSDTKSNTRSQQPHGNKPKPRTSSFVTGTQSEEKSPRKKCLHCDTSTHTLEVCRVVQKKPYDERVATLRKLGVCFGCVKKGTHLVKDCTKRVKCITCKGRHPTVLHRERGERAPQKSEVEASTTCGLTGAGCIASVLSVVPVTVLSRETGKVVKTYALLDSKSTAVFCSEDLKSQLAMKGTKTKIKIQTINGVKDVNTHKLTGLEVTDADGNINIELPDVYTQDSIPVHVKDIISKEDLIPWPYLQEITVPELLKGQTVDLLIGNNVPKALEPLEVIQSQHDGPYACRSALGWEIHGLTKSRPTSTSMASVHRITVEDLHNELVDLYNHDFNERTIEDRPQKSVEDKRFMDMVEKSIQLKDGHYQIKLPLSNQEIKFPNNKPMAESRISHLKRKFQRQPQFREEYNKAMSDTLQKGYAEEVPECEDKPDAGKIWYLPHHGVLHPKKKKLRVVFDCAASYKGVSLNKELLQGPDLTNSLVGVVSRFRQEPVALMADVEAMFNQVKVPEQDRDLLRFLWWPDSDTSKPLTEYRMTTHLFGATSSPSCSNFALKQTAVDNEDFCSIDVVETIKNNFYVDDCLKSVASEESAISLVKNISSTLQKGGFRLTKWVSNSRQVIDAVPEEDRAQGMRSLNLQDRLPVERALGVLWSAESDTFGFKIDIKDHPLTRRGLLSTVSSVYDPLGFGAPAILPARQILQDLCRQKLGWDDSIPKEHQQKWLEWSYELHKLEEFHINRCLKPPGFEYPTTVQMHHFADASGVGYGTASYIRLINSSNEVHCQLLMAKSRVAPLKKVTIPRMELTAATVAIRVDAMLRRELQIPIDESIFWTDSTTVLRYINSESARFHTFSKQIESN
ncbi:uncharacterized protein [Amphiura filiformis]|uniref:uncharacterized protein n=1 Tax=Amphiura filiformis TaxID=82378 RepID=UPI003B212FC1